MCAESRGICPCKRCIRNSASLLGESTEDRGISVCKKRGSHGIRDAGLRCGRAHAHVLVSGFCGASVEGLAAALQGSLAGRIVSQYVASVCGGKVQFPHSARMWNVVRSSICAHVHVIWDIMARLDRLRAALQGMHANAERRNRASDEVTGCICFSHFPCATKCCVVWATGPYAAFRGHS